MKSILSFLGIFSFSLSFAQITGPVKPTHPVTVDSDKPDTVKAVRNNSDFMFYMGAGRNNSYRVLETNDAPFGKPLGYRADEKHLKIWAYEVGLRANLNPHMQFDGGLSLERFGETYTSVAVPEVSGDSTYSYNNHYSYIAIPLQLYGTIGTDFKLYGGGGIQPGIVAKYNQELTITDSLGNATTTKVNSLEKLSGLTLNARVSGGFQWKWSSNSGMYVDYTYQFGLTSTYTTQDAYKHYIRAGSVRFGLYFIIPE